MSASEAMDYEGESSYGKKFKFEFERGGSLIADACEKEAPVSVRIFEKLCPYTFVVYHCCSAAHELTSDDVPITEPVPEENLCHFGELGDVATVSGNQSNELVGLEKRATLQSVGHTSFPSSLWEPAIRQTGRPSLPRFVKI